METWTSAPSRMARYLLPARVKICALPLCDPSVTLVCPRVSSVLAQDKGFVRDKYAKTFREVITEASSLNFSCLGLECDLAELRPTLELCKDRLLSLDLSKNKKLRGTLEAIGGVVQLTHVDLYSCRSLSGTICCLGTTST